MIMTRYTKNGEVYNGRFIEVDGMKLLSPSESVLLANGWERVTHEPTEAEVAEAERAAEQAEVIGVSSAIYDMRFAKPLDKELILNIAGNFKPTEAEVAEMERVAEIERLKEQLAATDYKAIKHAEGWLTDEEYAPTKAQRQQWRERINELEGGGDR